jgi:hypothetical protein
MPLNRERPGRKDRHPLPGRNDLSDNTVSISTTPNALRNRRFRKRQNRGVLVALVEAIVQYLRKRLPLELNARRAPR